MIIGKKTNDTQTKKIIYKESNTSDFLAYLYKF